jgi:hypothetical protein
MRQPSAFTLLHQPLLARVNRPFPKQRDAAPEIVSMIAELDRSTRRARP